MLRLFKGIISPGLGVAFFLACLGLAGAAWGAGLTVTNPFTDGDGVVWYTATSSFNGPGGTTLRVLPPTNPSPGMSHRFIYVLPVHTGVNLQSEFGDGLAELRALNIHNDYNAYIIAPSFSHEPWYADHDVNVARRYESFLIHDLVPWVQTNLSVTGQEEHWLVGFSKSGFGAVTLLFRNPDVFNAAAAWDLPADQPTAHAWGMLDNYGTDANFQVNYRLTGEWIGTRAEALRSARRLWLSDDHVTYNGLPTFRDQVIALAGRLSAQDVPYMLGGGGSYAHSWDSGWLAKAVAGLHEMRYTANDDFNRADGPLGSDWINDPLWGSGATIAGSQVAGPIGSGGAHYWQATSFGPDQYSEIKISGPVGDWLGVTVRAQVSPSQGYWLAIKPGGAYLYAFVNGVFHLLAHNPTPWSTGDTVRLEARTIGPNIARLTVARNGSPLLIHDDANHFISGGRPGFGLYASTDMSLDGWRGGERSPGQSSSTPSTPPSPATSALDDFNRPDGPLGPSWVNDPLWGSGAAIADNKLAVPAGSAGAYYWQAHSFGPDQYSQLKIVGPVGDWLGVAVRAQVSPSQGYWLAIKPSGAYLYSFLNGAFHLLAHNPTPWSTGDTVRLEALTIAPTTARLTVLRNGSALFTYDDADHFIPTGQPGLGLYAPIDMSFDDWAGGIATAGTEQPPVPAPSSALDDFNRADGPLGPNWVNDPLWGSGAAIAGNKLAGPAGSAGAHYWQAHSFGPDQYSELKIVGPVGDWLGVAVRAQVSPSQGYWLAIKPSGAYLYSFLNGAFHLLAHNPTPWSTGDTVRLEALTIAPTTARLTVLRNGSALFTYDDADHFIPTGQPGLGLYAPVDMSLDDWQGGSV